MYFKWGPTPMYYWSCQRLFYIIPRICKLVSEKLRMMRYLVLHNYSGCWYNNTMNKSRILSRFTIGVANTIFALHEYANRFPRILRITWMISGIALSFMFLMKQNNEYKQAQILISEIFLACFRESQEWYIVWYCVIIHIIGETIQYVLWQPSHLVIWDNNLSKNSFSL